MTASEFHWKSSDGIKIYGKSWSPDTEVHGVVCLVHGMGEHINRYEPLANYLGQHGYAVIGFDHRGHGKSEGKRGHTPSYKNLLEEVDELLNKAQEIFPEVPQVLYGHSMGGNVVANYVIDWQPTIAGAILSSPWLRLAFEPPALQVKLARVVRGILPSFTQSTKLDATAISRIPEEVQKYVDDPLVHDKISVQMFLSINEQGAFALQNAAEFHLPLLMFHGTADRLTSVEATREFAKSIKERVTLRIFENAYHEIHNDLPRFELFELIKTWLDHTIKPDKEE
ncbi:MAG: alpha/beta hydrolase [Chitinophagales bacterium]|nr:alpha/beta hydrolase [Chitinophagales bacterium]